MKNQQSRQITVTFDSNVWESIVDPEKRIAGSAFEAILTMIRSREILPFFSEGIATIETVPKQKRIDHFPSSRSKITMRIGDNAPTVTEGTPAHELSDYLSKNIPLALSLGFRFIRLPRAGAPRVPEELMAADTYVSLEDRLERSFNFVRHIESLGFGRSRMAEKTREVRLRQASRISADEKLPLIKPYAKAVAEWADGDALAAHYGYGLDYFCTNDRGRNAGAGSVFSEANLLNLMNQFSLKVVNPEELVTKLRGPQR